MLHRYWFTFEQSASPSVLNLGCGVTAFDGKDAQKLVEDRVFPVFGARTIVSVAEDIDVQTIEEGHVRPNMGSPVVRGVWFPLV